MKIKLFATVVSVVAAGMCPNIAGAAVKTYNVGANPGRMARGADGALWFTKSGAVGRITTAGAVRSYGLPALRSAAITDVLDLAVAPDGAVWATEGQGSLARIDRAGAVVEFAPPVLGMPAGVAIGPDGLVWFSDVVLGRITRFDPAGSFFDTVLGTVTGAFSRTDPASPTEMVLAPDGAVWILQLAPGRVGRMTADGAVSYHWLPGGAASAPTGVAVGGDGALWITEAGTNRIARMGLDGSVREHAIPSPGAEPRAIAAGPDGAMWFTEFGRDRLGRIDGTGSITEYQLPVGSQPYGIAAGPDGAIWATLWGKGGQVVRMTTDTPTTASAARRVASKKQAEKKTVRRR
jgi:virginiamycin B lyase